MVAEDGTPGSAATAGPDRGGTSDEGAVFRALADDSRRNLLDALRDRDGQSLGELCEVLPDMTRFGVMKHLSVLEEAHLVVTERVGRTKRHHLNPVPIREIHDRWISRYTEPYVAGLLALRDRAEGA
jgi:DNA-binding transcriptional ArsR family regulator